MIGVIIRMQSAEYGSDAYAVWWTSSAPFAVRKWRAIVLAIVPLGDFSGQTTIGDIQYELHCTAVIAELKPPNGHMDG